MEIISRYRKAIGFTQKTMAEKFGISTQAYYRKEKGHTPFNDSEKIVLREMFREINPNITLEELFFQENTKEYKEKE